MAYQATGRMPDELLNAPCVPENAAHVWWWFLELSKTRRNGFGISAIGYLDIDAWARLTKTKLEPWELRAICLLDAKFIEVHA